MSISIGIYFLVLCGYLWRQVNITYLMFQNRKTSIAFYNIFIKLRVEDRKRFSKAVKKLFNKKIVSENGQFQSFKIEVSDFKKILKDLKI